MLREITFEDTFEDMFEDMERCARCEHEVRYALTVRCTWCDACLCEHCVVRSSWSCAPCSEEQGVEARDRTGERSS